MYNNILTLQLKVKVKIFSNNYIIQLNYNLLYTKKKSNKNIFIGGTVATGIDPSLLTSAAFELVQASQALQAVQAVPQILHPDSPPIMTPLTQVGKS